MQPAASAGNGAAPPALLATTGGKGGNTTASGKAAGAGASISLLAGNGGDAPSGSVPGKGGSITLQPGSGGAAVGAGAKSGNVLLAPSGVGDVGIGTPAPASKFHIVSAGSIPPRLQSNETTSFAAGWDFYHGAAAKGYVGVPGTGVGSPGPGELLLYGGTGVKTSLWAGGTRGITIATNGNVGIGNTKPDSKLSVVGDASFTDGVKGQGYQNGTGVWGFSSTGDGVQGVSLSNSLSSDSAAIYGSNNSGGWAGYFDGPVKVTKGCLGCTTAVSDRSLKANISTVNPRSILDRLASVPIKAWNYKRDEPTVRHIGPMAQDFHAAFNLGADDKHIDMIDANGVTMASIQALYQMMLEKERQIERQMHLNEQQGQRIEQLQAQLNQVRRAVRRRRAAKRRGSR